MSAKNISENYAVVWAYCWIMSLFLSFLRVLLLQNSIYISWTCVAFCSHLQALEDQRVIPTL